MKVSFSAADTSARSRVATIDVARGAAMLFVCLAHFSDGLRDYDSGVSERALSWMVRVGMVATPTFVIVSGLTMGILLGTLTPSDATRFRLKLIDRCLFTLTVGHLLLVVAEGSFAGHFRRELSTVFITDIVALSTLAGLFVRTRLGTSARLLLAGAAFIGGWLLWALWHPTAQPLELLEEVLAGPTREHLLIVRFSPADVVRRASGRDRRRRDAGGRSLPGERRLAVLFGGAGVTMLGLSFVLRAVGYVLRHTEVVKAGPLAAILMSPWQKWPPSPIYLMFYGGIGLLTVSVIVLSAGVTPAHLRQMLGVVGRSSLATYIAQYFIFSTLVPLLAIPVGIWWPAFFAPLLALTVLFSVVWDREGGNRWLTVGLKRVPDPYRKPHPGPQP